MEVYYFYVRKKEKLSAYEELIKKYLDKQVENDTALKNVYDSAKIKECFKYITELAQKQAVNNCAMIEDSQVYKWARDYYFDELPKNADKQTVEIVQKATEKIDSAIKSADKVIAESDKVIQEANKVISKDVEDFSKYKNFHQMEFNF